MCEISIVYTNKQIKLFEEVYTALTIWQSDTPPFREADSLDFKISTKAGADVQWVNVEEMRFFTLTTADYPFGQRVNIFLNKLFTILKVPKIQEKPITTATFTKRKLMEFLRSVQQSSHG